MMMHSMIVNLVDGKKDLVMMVLMIAPTIYRYGKKVQEP
jgi:hypothetical protein